jgi:hypothetical protein
MTDGGTGTALPAGALWLSPAFFASEAAAPAPDVAVKVTTLSDPEVALRVFVPATGPSVHEPTVAMPAAFVDAVTPVTDPPPDTTAKVTDTPDVGLPLTSLTITDGGIATALPATALWLSPAFFASEAAAPAVDVAVNATGVRPPKVALTTLVPVVGPSVHEPTVAMPAAFVDAVAPVTDPPPDTTAKVTDTPDAGLPLASLTMTDGGIGTALPATALWLSPAFFASEAAAPAVDVAVNATGVRPPKVALTTLVPVVGPSVHEPTVAIPEAPEVTVAPETDPPPPTTANDTVAPLIGDPFWSFTTTDGAGVTTAPATPVMEIEELAASVVATDGAIFSPPLQLAKTIRRNAGTSRAALIRTFFTLLLTELQEAEGRPLLARASVRRRQHSNVTER